MRAVPYNRKQCEREACQESTMDLCAYETGQVLSSSRCLVMRARWLASLGCGPAMNIRSVVIIAPCAFHR